MNRLWVWISLILVGVVLFVAIFPFAYRTISRSAFGPPEWAEFTEPASGDPQGEARSFDKGAFSERFERNFWRSMAITISVGALVALLAGILLTRWMVAPLRRLEEGAGALAQRQLDHRVPVQGSVEMRSVADSFNQMASELETQENLRSNMLADVSHELRHPVHVLQGNLQAILDGVYPLDMEEIARLSEQTQGLNNLVNDLHELALAESRQLPLFKRPTNLNRLIQSAVEAFQPLFDERKIVLVLALPPDEMFLQVDPDRIRQALQNLIGNALRYTQENGNIKVDLKEPEGFALISVQDSGIGINAEDLAHVFDRFYRSDQARNRATSGTEEPGDFRNRFGIGNRTGHNSSA